MKNAKFWENRIIELMGNIHLCAKIDYILQTIVPYFWSIFVFTIILSERYAFDCACDGKTESSRSAVRPPVGRHCSLTHIKKSKPTMTGGRINWAGEEHFAYSRPSGPCLDRTFNAIVSICTAVFPRRASKSLYKSIFIPSSCWSCLWTVRGSTTCTA